MDGKAASSIRERDDDRDRDRLVNAATNDVCFWYWADMPAHSTDVCFPEPIGGRAAVSEFMNTSRGSINQTICRARRPAPAMRGRFAV
jgi:hypothetical protein